MNYHPLILNLGNAVPIYRRLKDQWEPRMGLPFYIKASPTRLIPWQMHFIENSVQTTGDIASVQLIGVSSGLGNTTMTVNVDYYVQLGTGSSQGLAWLTFPGNVTGAEYDCGIYYFKITTAKGQQYFSEQIQVVEEDWFTRESVHEIYWRDTKSHDKILYENGYTQRLYFDLEGCFRIPETVNAREVILNGRGQEIDLSNLNQYRVILDIPGMFDPWLYVFPKIRDHATKFLKQSTTSYQWALDQYEFEPTSNIFDSQGRISFIDEQFYKACIEQRTFVNAPVSA